MFKDFTPQEIEVLLATLRKAGDADLAIAAPARAEIAQAATTPIREVLLSGDITNGIFVTEQYAPGSRIEYPMDLLTPGQEAQFYAYVMPAHGRIPERFVESDYLMVPTYQIGSSIGCTNRYLRNANWNVLARMMQVLEAGVIKKVNDDRWQTILAAAVDRNILINDPNASAGQFTPRLISLIKTFMRRNGGGNTATLNRSRLTDLFVSPEAKDDIRAWNLELIPDGVRQNVYYSNDTGAELMKIFDVNIHDLDEFGEGQEYQNYYTSTLGASMASSDLEVVVGLDLQDRSTFVAPVEETWRTFEDNTQHRQGIFSVYGWQIGGAAILDSRKTIIGSI